MIENILALLISAAVIYGYCGFIVKKYGIQKSISHSVYVVKPWYLFSITMMTFPIPFIFAAENLTHNWIGEFTSFWGGALICLVGVAHCFYKPDKREETLHTIGATGGISLALIYTVSLRTIYLIPTFLYILFVIYCVLGNKYRKYKGSNKIKLYLKDHRILCHTWYIEIVAIDYIFAVVLIETLIK